MAVTRPVSIAEWAHFALAARVFDLEHPLEVGMPATPAHPSYRMALVRRHGDMFRAEGASAANELLTLSGHTGTHLDALAHVSLQGKLHGGVDAYEAQVGGRFKKLGIDTVGPILCPGVLLDVAGYQGVEVLSPAPITAADLRAVALAEGVAIPENGAVLIRSGWARLWGNPEAYLGRASGVPGPDVSAAEWLGELRAKVTAHDSMAYEHMVPGIGPAHEPVHPILLVKHGIHIVENINLEELAAARIYEFLFVCLPLKLVGATGSPVRPIAIAFQ